MTYLVQLTAGPHMITRTEPSLDAVRLGLVYDGLPNTMTVREAVKELDRIGERGGTIMLSNGLTIDVSLEESPGTAASAQADVKIQARSWDPEAAGRRAVEKHEDALKRLSDESPSSDLPKETR